MRRWALFFFTLLLCVPAWVWGQDSANPPTTSASTPVVAAERGRELEVSVITLWPGPLVYERFGHIGIRLHNVETGLDVVFDWGNFDFEEPNFIGKFLKGSLLYSMQGKPAERWLEFYQVEMDRTIVEQVLNLDADQKSRLRDALAKNLESPYYLYDSYLDNCSTRVRDVIDTSTQGQLAAQWGAKTAHGFRWHTQRLLDVGLDNKTLSVLIDFCCGPRVDRPVSQWESAFVPMELSRLIDSATVKRTDGSFVPLVLERRQLNVTKSAGNAEPSSPPRLAVRTLPIGLLLAGLTVAASRFFRIGFWTLAGLWSAFAAFGTLFFLFIIVFTRHWPFAWNENFLQFSPVSIVLLLAIIVPRWRKPFATLPAVALGLSILGLAITIPTLQENAPAVALALPLHAAVWLGWKPKQLKVREASTEASSG